MKKRTYLQSHRIKAFSKTIEQVEVRLSCKIQFLQDYAEVYKMPIVLTRRSIRRYRKFLKATQILRELETRDLK